MLTTRDLTKMCVKEIISKNLPVRQVAAAANVSEGTIRGWVKEGRTARKRQDAVAVWETVRPRSDNEPHHNGATTAPQHNTNEAAGKSVISSETKADYFGRLSKSPRAGAVHKDGNIRGANMQRLMDDSIPTLTIEVIANNLKLHGVPIEPGNILLVDKTSLVSAGRVVVADVSRETEDHQWVLRKYEIHDGKQVLTGLAEDWKPFQLDQDPRRWYVVKGLLFCDEGNA